VGVCQDANTVEQPPLTELEVLVVNRGGEYIDDIKKDELVLKVNGKERQIQFLEQRVYPVVYVLAIDNSGSVRPYLPAFAQAANYIIKQNDERDSVIALQFAGKNQIQMSGVITSGVGETALTDAIYKAVQIASEQKGHGLEFKRAVVVLSDGNDTGSRYSYKALLKLLSDSNVPVFFLGLQLETVESIYGRAFIEDVTKRSNGVAVICHYSEDVPIAAAQIARMVRTRYVIMYRKEPTDETAAKIEFKFVKNSKRKGLTFTFRRG
jgi:hypothetical protein